MISSTYPAHPKCHLGSLALYRCHGCFSVYPRACACMSVCMCACVCLLYFWNFHVLRTTKIHKNKLINGLQFWQLQEDRWESNMLLAACYQLGGNSAFPLCGTVSWNRHWQMTQPLTVKSVQVDSSTCSQSSPHFALEGNQVDLQNMLVFICLFQGPL